MKRHRVVALVARHLYLYRRSLPRIMEIFYWPFLDLVIWGFITMYLAKYQPQVPGFVTFFLGALILWDMLFRSQQGITISFLEELWARNLMNLFASPLSPAGGDGSRGRAHRRPARTPARTAGPSAC